MNMMTIKTFKYSELSDSAKERVLETMREICVDYGWWDSIFDDIKTIGKCIGINISNIYFTGFSSQGDGACFTGEYSYKKGWENLLKEYCPLEVKVFEIGKALQDIQRKYFYSICASVEHDGSRYFHEYSADIDVYDRKDIYTTHDYEADIPEVMRNFMRWIYYKLEEQYDFLTSEEAVVEVIEKNEFVFTEYGELFKY